MDVWCHFLMRTRCVVESLEIARNRPCGVRNRWVLARGREPSREELSRTRRVKEYKQKALCKRGVFCYMSQFEPRGII
jgi:hypothetical protein